MKKIHIVLIVFLAAIIGVIFYSLQSSETYASFKEASNNMDKTFHVVGSLDKEKDVIYEPTKDANLFTFYLKDKEGTNMKVFLHKAKPQDFDKSEQIVVIGKMKEDGFHAKDILTKCPSKYNDAQTTQVQ